MAFGGRFNEGTMEEKTMEAINVESNDDALESDWKKMLDKILGDENYEESEKRPNDYREVLGGSEYEEISPEELFGILLGDNESYENSESEMQEIKVNIRDREPLISGKVDPDDLPDFDEESEIIPLENREILGLEYKEMSWDEIGDILLGDNGYGENGDFEREEVDIGDVPDIGDLIQYEDSNTEENADAEDLPEKGKPIQNKVDGLQREAEVQKELEEKYPKEEGYEIVSEAYLRDADGNIVKDPETGKARRIDFVVVKDGKVVDSIEVTSKTADKTEQTDKENRIRENGGNYIRDNNGNLIEIPETVQTRIERRD